MSYHIYTTKGLVLKATPLREADRVYAILTRDLGLVHASATGVRKEQSKLRGSLEPFSLSRVSFVRGKEYWRITSAELLEKVPATPAVAKPLALLQSLVHGEEGNPQLFDAVEDHLASSETMLAARILYHLGYLKEEDLKLEESALIAAINEGLRQSQLA